MGLTTPLAQIVSVLCVNLWKVVMKCKNVFSLTFEPFISKCIFLRLRHFFSPSAYPINSILPVYKIHDFDEAFLLLAAVAMMNEFFFSLFPWQPFLGKQILSSQSKLSLKKNGVKHLKTTKNVPKVYVLPHC